MTSHSQIDFDVFLDELYVKARLKRVNLGQEFAIQLRHGGNPLAEMMRQLENARTATVSAVAKTGETRIEVRLKSMPLRPVISKWTFDAQRSSLAAASGKGGKKPKVEDLQFDIEAIEAKFAGKKFRVIDVSIETENQGNHETHFGNVKSNGSFSFPAVAEASLGDPDTKLTARIIADDQPVANPLTASQEMRIKQLDTFDDGHSLNPQSVRYGKDNCDAIEEHYQRRRKALIYYASLRISDPHTCEDIVQEAYIALKRAIKRGDVPNWDAYLSRTVSNLCTNWIRKKDRRGVGGDDKSPETLDKVTVDPLWQLLNREDLDKMLFEALPKLNEKDRALLELRYLDGCTISEIGDCLEIPYRLVSLQLSRATERLRIEFFELQPKERANCTRARSPLSVGISMVTQQTDSDQYGSFCIRNLSALELLAVWAEGYHLYTGESFLVLAGATPEGKKELIALKGGVATSSDDWKELVTEITKRGLKAPEIIVGRKELGLWSSLDDSALGTAKQQFCLPSKKNINSFRKQKLLSAWEKMERIRSCKSKKDATSTIESTISKLKNLSSQSVRDNEQEVCHQSIAWLTQNQDSLVQCFEFSPEWQRYLYDVSMVDKWFESEVDLSRKKNLQENSTINATESQLAEVYQTVVKAIGGRALSIGESVQKKSR